MELEQLELLEAQEVLEVLEPQEELDPQETLEALEALVQLEAQEVLVELVQLAVLDQQVIDSFPHHFDYTGILSYCNSYRSPVLNFSFRNS